MLKQIKKLIKNILFRPYGLKKIATNSYIKWPYLVEGRDCISIGSNSFIHKNSEIIAIKNDNGKYFNPKIKIGNNVYISGASHGFNPNGGLIMHQDLTYKDINIGDNCFIGRNVFISLGVTLGENCVVGANSVVTKSFPKYSMIGGIPAKVLKKFSFEKNDWIKIDN